MAESFVRRCGSRQLYSYMRTHTYPDVDTGYILYTLYNICAQMIIGAVREEKNAVSPEPGARPPAQNSVGVNDQSQAVSVTRWQRPPPASLQQPGGYPRRFSAEPFSVTEGNRSPSGTS